MSVWTVLAIAMAIALYGCGGLFTLLVAAANTHGELPGWRLLIWPWLWIRSALGWGGDGP